MADFTKGEWFVGCGDEDWYVASKVTNTIVGRFHNKGDALLDAKAPRMYEALKVALARLYEIDDEIATSESIYKQIESVLAEIEEGK